MTHPAFSILTLSVALWLTDTGFAQRVSAQQIRAALACHETTQSPGTDGSDLEIVVCASSR
jgi:hypothetical protein